MLSNFHHSVHEGKQRSLVCLEEKSLLSLGGYSRSLLELSFTAEVINLKDALAYC
jgi:hypothetical protein